MNRAALHSQLASVMEMLANAAVVEICKLVDEGFALLRSEVSRAQTENRALRRRIQMMEPRKGGCGAREPFGSENTDGLCSEERRPLPVQSHRKGDPDAEDTEDFPALPGTVDQSAACESLLIKEEKLEEDSDPGRVHNTELQPSADRAASAKSSPGRGESRHGTFEVGALETVLKMEAEKSCTDNRLQNELSAHAPYGERSAAPPDYKQLHSFFAQGVGRMEVNDPSCSYAAEMESESLSFHSELPSIPVAEDDEGSQTPLGSPQVKQELIPVDPMTEEAEVRTHCLWNHSTISSRMAVPSHHKSRGDGCRDRKQQGGPFNTQRDSVTEVKCDPSDVTGFVPCDRNSIPLNDTTAHSRATRREKLFICTICGKAFNRPKKVEIHLRVHTGEKPFRCTLCGKWFAESGNLKKHQRVHTGEKPFSCVQCGRRFAWIRNLKTHQLRSHT